jgi:predicted amidohydrolase
MGLVRRFFAVAAVTCALFASVAAAELSVAAVQFLLESSTSQRGGDIVAGSADAFAYVATQAVLQYPTLDVLTFPEFALMGVNYSFTASGFCDAASPMNGGLAAYCFTVPATGATLDCNSTDVNNPLIRVACSANSSMYSNVLLSINVCEKTTRTYDQEVDEAAADTVRFYNTQVFIRSGVVVSIYRKSHPFYGSCFSTPKVQYDIMNVTSNAGGSHSEALGVFTCFDIMFSQPKEGLLKRGVRLFSYSSAIPLVGSTVVKLFSWTSNSTVISSNNAMGETGIFSRGSTLAKCSKSATSPSASGAHGAGVVSGKWAGHAGEVSFQYCIAHANV